MTQTLRTRPPARLQPYLARPTFRNSRLIKLTIIAKAANNDEKTLFIFGMYMYRYLKTCIEP
jgi:hypothetical protein